MRYMLLGLACLASLAAAPPTGPELTAPPTLKLDKADRMIALHKYAESGVDFSPDGRVVSTSGDGVVTLLHAASGRRLRTFQGHKEFLRQCSFSPDGSLIASGGNDPAIVLWDPDTGKEVRRLPLGAHLYRAVFTPDGKTLVSGDFGAMVRVWDVASGKELRSWSAHKRVVYALAVSPDGKTLATGGDNDRSVRLWELATGCEVRSWQAHPRHVKGVAFSPDGRWLASGGDDDTARVWEVATGKEVRRLPGLKGGGYRQAFSPDGRFLVSAGYQQRVLVWDLLSGKEVCRLGDHGSWIWGMALSPDGGSLLTCGNDGAVVRWDLRSRLSQGAPAKKALTAAQRGAAWDDLGGDPGRAYAAVYALAGDPGESVALVGKHLRPVRLAKLDRARVARLIGELDSDEFETREKASAELNKLAPQALPLLEKALADASSAEVRRRLRKIVAAHTGELSPEELRRLRGVHVLEEAGTKEARELLKALAGGDEEAELTRQAKAALARLEKGQKK